MVDRYLEGWVPSFLSKDEEDKKKIRFDGLDEKQELDDLELNYFEEGLSGRDLRIHRNWFVSVRYLMLRIFVVLLVSAVVSSSGYGRFSSPGGGSVVKKVGRDGALIPMGGMLLGSDSTYDIFAGDGGVDDETIIKFSEVTMEGLPVKNRVHRQHLFSHAYGDSWGKPWTESFVPWRGGLYDKVYLELVTNVTGTQYDRLVHVFMDNITVWRSSTIEPYRNRVVQSRPAKDISKYISLFNQEIIREVNLTVQLDNIITPDIDGVFYVEIYAHYYCDACKIAPMDISNYTTVYQNLLSYSLTPADYLLPLLEIPTELTPVISYSPAVSDGRISVGLVDILPELSAIKKLVVELYASGNSKEEFWYGNLLNDTVRYTNDTQDGMVNGPLRQVNIYLTSKAHGKSYLAESLVPSPTIYTGGMSPPLWKPYVSIDAFDVQSILVDLSAFLPLLQANEDISDWAIEIEVVSSLADDSNKSIGENWIITGNLLMWYAKSLGTNISYTKFEDSTFDKNFLPELQGTVGESLYQSINSSSVLDVLADIVINNQSFKLVQTTSTEYSSNLNLTNSFNDEDMYVKLDRIKTFSLHLPESQSLFARVVEQESWLLIAETRNAEVNNTEGELNYLTSVTRDVSRSSFAQEFATNGTLFKTTQALDSSPKLLFSSLHGEQYSDAVFTISPNGNRGTGNSVNSVHSVRDYPYFSRYSRKAIARQNSILMDDISRV
ncbi:uncharacterized protein Ecym_5211 [Eremothecium cymbalariae DBVPG|uniref:Peptide N-acetyl-beta-D-glucosaminyl asparaginase amidase A N-terminal domain-containing protein n=1 Tax=Eremothecium cymbalariae (strain CBS 270.75 / DBVPG 7215 / KCTC 17166 / NRRL Y-17582) TaxID=931890 RepID=I6ND38_ERECY|nr:hypothetical protein Ecym_5211 [Eremothecium cymbalariae DBVPG\